jgi:hypothetical protein
MGATCLVSPLPGHTVLLDIGSAHGLERGRRLKASVHSGSLLVKHTNTIRFQIQYVSRRTAGERVTGWPEGARSQWDRTQVSRFPLSRGCVSFEDGSAAVV